MKGFRGIMGGQQMDKIDRLAVKGLLGVEDSLAYQDTLNRPKFRFLRRNLKPQCLNAN